MTGKSRGTIAAALFSLLAGFVIIHFPHMNDIPWHGEDEIRDARIVAEMTEADNIVVPRLDGAPYPDKPPLYFWAAVGTARIVGEVNQLATRLPSFLGGAALIVLLFLAGTGTFDLRAGLLAAVVCGTSLCFDEVRIARMNLLMTLFVTGATLGLYAAWRTGRRGWALAAGLCMGLAMLTKGPFGYIMPMATMGSYLLARREWRSFMRFFPVSATLVAVAVFLAWYIPASSMGVADHLALSPFDHHQPWYFYFPRVLQILAPWTLFLIPAIAAFRRQPEGRDKDFAFFCLIWLCATFVVVSLYPPKRLSYLLFLLPSFALFMGWSFSIALRPGADEGIARWYNIAMRITAILMMTAMAAVVVVAGISFEILAPTAFVIAGGLTFAFCGVFWLAALKRPAAAFVLYTGAVLAGWAADHIFIESVIVRNYTRTTALPGDLHLPGPR